MKKEFFFEIAWRLAVLVLPWQTRWFSDAALGGWPWEQGRWSVYVSWVLLVGACALAPRWEGWNVFSQAKKNFAFLLGGLVMVTVFALYLNPLWHLRFPAVAQWWIQMILIFAFSWTLWHARVSSASFVTMFVFSLLPHVAIGFWQYAIQYVAPIKWLGIAAQDPRNLGVSVVEAGFFRNLRIYGGFPHPNIFGGWLALGVVFSTWLAARSETKRRAIGWSVVTAIYAVALLLTFARGAWIAAFFGILLLALGIFRKQTGSLQFAVLAIFSSVFLTGVVGYTQRHLLVARVQLAERIEQKSFDVRKQSLVDGWKLFLERPLFGSGPNAELLDLVSRKLRPGSVRLIEPIQPPHSVYLWFLVDFSVVGLAVIAISATRRLRYLKKAPISFWILGPLGVLALFDHYLISSWAGQTLAACALLVLFLPQTRTQAEDSRG